MHRTSQQPKRQQVGSIFDKSGTKNSEINLLHKVCVRVHLIDNSRFDMHNRLSHSWHSPSLSRRPKNCAKNNYYAFGSLCYGMSLSFLWIHEYRATNRICIFHLRIWHLIWNWHEFNLFMFFFLNESVCIFIWMDLIKFNLHRNTDRKRNLREYAVHVTYCDEFINFCCCHLMLLLLLTILHENRRCKMKFKFDRRHRKHCGSHGWLNGLERPILLVAILWVEPDRFDCVFPIVLFTGFGSGALVRASVHVCASAFCVLRIHFHLISTLSKEKYFLAKETTSRSKRR